VFGEPVWKKRPMFSAPTSVKTNQQLSVTVPEHGGMLEKLIWTFRGMSKSADQPWIAVDPMFVMSIRAL
jgi:hypothetical protein